MIAAVVVLAGAAPPQATAAPKAAPASCKSTDLRYPFMKGGPKDFGVFKLQITGGSCTTAHRVAKGWITRFETALRGGHVKVPRSVDGFSFTTPPANAAQTYRERGSNGTATIRFDYRIPNG